MAEKIAENILWLLKGDVSVQYQTRRDLLDENAEDIRKKIAVEGWGKALFELRDLLSGLWGNGLYGPKWISTHYILLQLKNMGAEPSHEYRESSEILLNGMWQNGPSPKTKRWPDLCVCAMILSICCYARISSPKLYEIVEYILDRQYPDGGFNCNWQNGDKHSSLHTTLTVLEAFDDYEANGYSHKLTEIKEIITVADEFILKKNLFRSVHTGEIIHPSMLMLSYPCRWNTLRVLRVLRFYKPEIYSDYIKT